MCLFPANVFVADYSFVGAMRGRWKSHHLCDFNKFSIVILTCAAMRLQFRPWLLSPCLLAVWKQLQLNKQEHGVALPLPHIILPVKIFFLLWDYRIGPSFVYYEKIIDQGTIRDFREIQFFFSWVLPLPMEFSLLGILMDVIWRLFWV